MAFADTGACISYFLSLSPDSYSVCQAQALLQQLFELSSVLWATVIATTLNLAVRKQESLADIKHHRLYCYGYAWAIPFVVCLLPLMSDSYGLAGAWCWIKEKPRAESHAWRFSIFYGPVWCAIVYNGYVYTRCIIVLRRLSSVASDEAAFKLRRTIQRLMYYPLILVIGWTPGTINRLQQLVHPKHPVFALYVLTVLSRSLIGFFNALAFLATENVRSEWRGALFAAVPPAEFEPFCADAPPRKERKTSAIEFTRTAAAEEVENIMPSKI
mmetsp:Transcript_16181/g.55297  ORF Transcript_16181/g.55297 Transcript_16181/m.55297 type:complete len:271 (-) Transcript_16181:1141-1953(-)